MPELDPSAQEAPPALPQGRNLIDNSVYARAALPEVAPIWAEALRADRLVSSGPLVIEALHSTRSTDLADAFEELTEGLPFILPDGETWHLAHRAQLEMGRVAPEFHRRPPIDYLTAALAHQHDLGVLHYDGDCDLLAEHSGLRFASRWVVPRGTLRETSTSALRPYRRAIRDRLARFTAATDQEALERVIELLDEELRVAGKTALPPVEA